LVARITFAEIDTVRISLAGAIERFRDLVVPALMEQEGLEGFYLLTTEEGKGVVLTFWADDEAAEATLASGYYAEQLEKFVTLFGSPPGREHYTVSMAEAPAVAVR
jgi:heme-degrading monooxygenase HmoA